MVKNPESGTRTSAQERRRFGRFATRLPIATRRDDLAENGQPDRRAQCRLQLQDFSLGGLCAESPIRLKRNERLTMQLPPNGTHPGTQLTGRVIHCRRKEKRYQVGIELCETREGAATSPYRHLPRLFSVAMKYGGETRPVESLAKL